MTTNLGDLDQFIGEHDLTFQWGGKEYACSYPLQAVLELRREILKGQDNRQEGETEADLIYRITAPVLGSTYDREAGKFTGGLIAKVTRENKDFNWRAIHRLLYAVWSEFRFGSADVAQKYAATGDLGKALGLDKMRDTLTQQAANGSNAAPASQETSPAPGETGGDGSDETPTT